MGDTKNNDECEHCFANPNKCDILKREIKMVVDDVVNDEKYSGAKQLYTQIILNTAKKYLTFHAHDIMSGTNKYKHIKWTNYMRSKCEITEPHDKSKCIFWHEGEFALCAEIPQNKYEQMYVNFKHVDKVVDWMRKSFTRFI